MTLSFFALETSFEEMPTIVDTSPRRGHPMDFKYEIKEEMELLSKAIAEVQKCDGQLFEAKQAYQKEISEARRKLYKMYKSYKNAIEKAKPYYMLKDIENQMHEDLLQVDSETERSRFNFEDAKENESMANGALQNAQASREKFTEQDHSVILDNWNRATKMVMDASTKRAESEDILRKKELQFLQAQTSADQIFMDLKPHITKAWPYYTFKEQLELTLEASRLETHKFARTLNQAKDNYKSIFARLNLVATEIQQRKNLSNRHNGSDNSNLSQFEEVSNIDAVLFALEAKTDNLSSSFNASLKHLQDSPEDQFGMNYDFLVTPSAVPSFSRSAALSSPPLSPSLIAVPADFANSAADISPAVRGCSKSPSHSSLDLDKKIAADLVRQAEERRSSVVAAESLAASVAESIAHTASQPVTESVAELVTESNADPIAVVDQVNQPVLEQLVEPLVVPLVEPIAEPLVDIEPHIDSQVEIVVSSDCSGYNTADVVLHSHSDDMDNEHTNADKQEHTSELAKELVSLDRENNSNISDNINDSMDTLL